LHDGIGLRKKYEFCAQRRRTFAKLPQISGLFAEYFDISGQTLTFLL